MVSARMIAQMACAPNDHQAEFSAILFMGVGFMAYRRKNGFAFCPA